MIPAWLDQHIRTHTGAAPGARNANPHRCRTCRAQVLTGLDNDWAALDATADPTPLGHQGEALAHLTGLTTYALRRRGNRYQLTRRDRWQVPTRRNWPTSYDVVAQHQCHAPPLPGIPSAYQPAKTRGVTDDQPPF